MNNEKLVAGLASDLNRELGVTSDELPEKPDGWTKRQLMHMNFGDEGGAATYDIYNPSGVKAVFGYQYDTRKGGLTGFLLPKIDGVLTWTQLRHKWPIWIAERKQVA